MNIEHKFPMSKESLLYMTMLTKRVGIDLQSYKEITVYNRLVRRLRMLNMPDFDTYCQRLRVDMDEEIKFINLITNVTTFFFRENHHFEYLTLHILPKFLSKKKKIRIWSAACSTGEEPYSIAIAINELIPNLEQYDIKILATDVNTDALLIAETGIYNTTSIRNVSPARRAQWFTAIEGDSLHLKVNDKVKKLVTFSQLNLMHIWSFKNMFDVIFCRNVLIYFNKKVVFNVLHKLDKSLHKNAYLFLGYSEDLDGIKENYAALGKSIFQKIR